MTTAHPAAPPPAARHGRSAADACSVEWDAALDATVYGTAAPARFWVGLEQSGPWGRNAATQSHLPADLGAALDRACAQRGGRLSLLRQPGQHPDHPPCDHHVLVAWTGTRERPAYLLATSVADAATLLHLDLDALGCGDLDGVRASLPGLIDAAPTLLVCTNGRRDVCCAVRGRPMAIAGHAAYPGRVWECSHTGGHRFSPTGVLLPWGRTLARLTDESVSAALDASDDGRLARGLLGPGHDRGSSALSPRHQVAESAVRDLLSETDPSALSTSQPDGADVVVTHTDGRTWRVTLSVVEGESRHNSCHEVAVPARTWHAEVTAQTPLVAVEGPF